MRGAVAGRPTSSQRPSALWIAGAATGVVLALVGLLQRSTNSGSLRPQAVASVNDVEISSAGYQRALDALARDRRTPPDAAERRRVLERLIDGELLLQRALELGLARMERTVRASLVDALIASVTAEASDTVPARAELERFYAEDPDVFRQPGRVRVREVFVRVGDDDDAAWQRAATAGERVAAGAPISVVADALGDHPVAVVPDALLPPAKLREYVGPTALRAVLALHVGEVTAPVRSGGGYHVLELLERSVPFVPAFAGMEATVRAEYRRRAGERALADYLADLRARATIIRSDQLP